MAAESEQPSRRALATLFGVIIIDLIGFGIVMPILPFYAKSLDASPVVLGLLLAVYPLFQFALGPVWGRLSDRIGRRPVILITIAGTTAALLLMGLADSLALLFAARVLGGIFGANISVATAYITDVTDEAERTRWMGLVGASFGVGFVLGPAIGGALAPNLDGSWPAAALLGTTLASWVAPFGFGIPVLFAAALAGINLAFAARTLSEPDRHTTRDPGQSRWAVLRNPVVARLCAMNLVYSLAVTQLESIFAYFMIDRFGYQALQVAFILVGMGVLMAGVQGGAIRPLVARFGERRVALTGFATMALAFFAIPFAGGVAMTLIPLALSAVGRGIGQPPMMGLVSLATSESNRGSVMGTFQSAASLARVFGPAAAGVAYAQWSAAPFLLAGLLMTGAFILSIGLREGESS
jgi:MFS family permease